jgi:hypothetical protein
MIPAPAMTEFLIQHGHTLHQEAWGRTGQQYQNPVKQNINIKTIELYANIKI